MCLKHFYFNVPVFHRDEFHCIAVCLAKCSFGIPSLRSVSLRQIRFLDFPESSVFALRFILLTQNVTSADFRFGVLGSLNYKHNFIH